MKRFLSVLASISLSLSSFGQTQGVSQRATNGVAFGDTIVQYHVNATNLATTNTFAGRFQQGQGTTANGTGASAFGLGTRSSGSYSFSSGVGSVNSGFGAFASGRSNTIGSSALGSFVSGSFNNAVEPGLLISGYGNNGQGSNSFIFGTSNSAEDLTHNSFVGGQGITVQAGASNNFVWNGDPATPLLIQTARSNAFTVVAPGGIFLDGPISLPGLTNAGITNEIFSYNLSASAVAGATSVVLDRSLASVSSSAGRVYIGWNTTNMEIRPASTVSGATVSFSVPLVFNHASGQRVVYSQSSESFPLATGTVPGNDSGWEMLQLLKTSGDNAVIVNGVGQTISSTLPFVVPNSTHLRNVKLNAISGFPLGNTNVYMYMSRQDERYAFTANSATDVITVPGGWNPPVSASNATVVFYDLGAGTLPQPLSNGVPYFVVTNSATALTVKGNIGDSAAINLTTSGSGFMDSEAGSLVKTYLEDVYLDGGVQPNINGLWANIQQQSYLNNVRIANVATGLRLMGQQADWNNLEIGPCGIGIDMRAGPLDQNGAQFMYFKTLNIEQFTTNAIVLGGNNNVFIGTHLEGGTSTTAPVIDGSQAPSYSVFENLVVGSMSGTNDIFRMGTSGGFAASYDLRNVNVIAATPDGPMWLLNDLYRNIRIPAYSSTNGVPDRFVGRIFAPPIPSSLDFPSIFGGETWVSQAGRYFTGPQQHQNEPLLMAQAGTNDTGPLFTFRRSDGSSNVSIYGYGMVIRSNAASGAFLRSDASGLADWSFNGSGLTNISSANVNGVIPVLNVLDFGADPTATVNSYVAIQAALNAVPASGARVYIPEGSYNVSNRLTLKEGTWLEGACSQGGDETTLFISGTGGVDTTLLYASHRNITVKNLNLNGASTTLHTGFETSTNAATPTFDFRLDNVQFEEMKIGAYLHFAWNGEIIGCGSSGCMHSGMLWSNQVNSVHVIGGDWKSGGNGLTVIDENSVGNVISAAFEDNTNGIVLTNQLIGFNIDGSYFEGQKKYDIYADGGPSRIEKLNIENSVFLHNHVGTNIYLANIDSATVQNNNLAEVNTNAWMAVASTVQKLYHIGNTYDTAFYDASPGGADINTNALFKADVTAGGAYYGNGFNLTNITFKSILQGGFYGMTLTTTARYHGFGDGSDSDTIGNGNSILPVACTLTNLYVLEHAVGAGTNVAFTVMTNNVATHITCGALGTGTGNTATGSDLTHGVAVAAGTLVTVRTVGNNASASASNVKVGYAIQCLFK